MSTSGLFTKIYRDIINDKLSVISMPSILIRLRKALGDQNMSVTTLARVIQTDVGASAYVLNIANSAVYRTRVEATNIQSAIRMMGIPTFTSLITAYAFKSIVKNPDPLMQKYVKKHWKRSAYRAAIASAIARLTNHVNVDKALLAGLLQDVGALPILMKLQSEHLQSLSGDDIDQALNEYSRKIGVILARKWELDENFIEVIRNRGNLSYDGGEKTDLVDVVNIAQMLSQIGDRDMKWPRLEKTPCLMKFGKDGLTMETSLSLLKEARDDINSIKQVLSG